MCCAPVAPTTPFFCRVRWFRLACSGRLPPSAQFRGIGLVPSPRCLCSPPWRYSTAPLSRAECVAAARCVCVMSVYICLDTSHATETHFSQLYQGFLKLPLS